MLFGKKRSKAIRWDIPDFFVTIRLGAIITQIYEKNFCFLLFPSKKWQLLTNLLSKRIQTMLILKAMKISFKRAMYDICAYNSFRVMVTSLWGDGGSSSCFFLEKFI